VVLIWMDGFLWLENGLVSLLVRLAAMEYVRLKLLVLGDLAELILLEVCMWLLARRLCAI